MKKYTILSLAVALAAVLFGASSASALEACSTKNSNSNIVGGSGKALKSRLFFFDWSGVQIKDGAKVTKTLSNGVQLVATINSAEDLSALKPVKYGWSTCANCANKYYDVAASEHPAFGKGKTLPVVVSHNFTVTVSAKKNGKSFPLEVVVADAEQLSGAANTITYKTTAPMKLLEKFGTEDNTSLSADGKTLTLHRDDVGDGLSYYSVKDAEANLTKDSSIAVTTKIESGMPDAVTYGVVLPCNKLPEINATDKTIEQGDKLDLKSLLAGATDKENGDLTNNVTVKDDGGFDPNKVGVYSVVFVVPDKDGNYVEKTVKVTVVAKKPATVTPQAGSKNVNDDKNSPKLADTGSSLYLAGVAGTILLLTGVAIIKNR